MNDSNENKDFILELSKYTPQEINDLLNLKGKIKSVSAIYVELTKDTQTGDNN